jgi:16S rRNA (adenine1518-N6/adenine1519-N6)-dimethyltransferase
MGARYGQHFLHDPRAIAAILDRFAARPSDRIVEIGPGRGALTTLLAPQAHALAAVEIDPDLARRLASGLSLGLVRPEAEGSSPFTAIEAAPIDASEATKRRALRFASGAAAHDEDEKGRANIGLRRALRFVVLADALTVSYEDLARLLEAAGSERLRVIGNLPYGVATALVQRMIAARDRVADAMIMVQKEVADRLLAGPGGKEYGFLSVVLALCSERARLMTLGAGAFSPAPRVRSSVISLRFPVPARASRLATRAWGRQGRVRRGRWASNPPALTIDRDGRARHGGVRHRSRSARGSDRSRRVRSPAEHLLP